MNLFQVAMQSIDPAICGPALLALVIDIGVGHGFLVSSHVLLDSVQRRKLPIALWTIEWLRVTSCMSVQLDGSLEGF